MNSSLHAKFSTQVEINSSWNPLIPVARSRSANSLAIVVVLRGATTGHFSRCRKVSLRSEQRPDVNPIPSGGARNHPTKCVAAKTSDFAVGFTQKPDHRAWRHIHRVYVSRVRVYRNQFLRKIQLAKSVYKIYYTLKTCTESFSCFCAAILNRLSEPLTSLALEATQTQKTKKSYIRGFFLYK